MQEQKTATTITPTIGRKVWYWPTDHQRAGAYGMQQLGTQQPLDATVVAVWSDRCVNLAVVDHAGKHFAVMSATLCQPDDTRPGAGGYAEWMPYQKGQAKA